ncbi:ATP-binding cassette domain-containing protein [Streptomyces sp. NPDC102381]|uniref:ATP-binding cassette domain-containing protein n=1 Tax=Streptomyces sp. NPDC102381 TaxID=3366164 RepID=UPI003816A0D8
MVVGRATDLSGGRRQRLALARALLSDAPAVLLDEPTSQLDSASEHTLRTAVDRLAQNRAVIVVAHRLSTVQHAQNILYFGPGRAAHPGPTRGTAHCRSRISPASIGPADPLVRPGPDTHSMRGGSR